MAKSKNKNADLLKLKYGPGGTVLEFNKSKTQIALRANVGKKISRSFEQLRVIQDIDQYTIYEINSVVKTTELDNTLDDIREIEEVAVGTHLYHLEDDHSSCIPSGEIYLIFKDSASLAACEDILEEFSLEIIEARAEKELIVRTTKKSRNPMRVSVELQNRDEVELAEPDLLYSQLFCNFSLPKDELLDQQWHLKNNGIHQGTRLMMKEKADARVVNAWQKAQTLGSSEVIVAIIDDGFDMDHPDLKGNNKMVHAYDFERHSNDPSPNPEFKDNHGTSCAGVAVGNANGVGIVGAAPNCKLMPIRMSSTLSDRQVEQWFNHAEKNGAWVVSCSWMAVSTRYKLSTRKFEAIKNCAEKGRNGKGTIICFAAGNNGDDIDSRSTYNGFATHPNVLAITASNSRDKKSDYSNLGSKSIAVCAPSNGAGGRGIVTADVTGTYKNIHGIEKSKGYSPGPYYDNFGGTSSACPLVAGICALAFSVAPDIKAEELTEVVKRTARKIGEDGAYNAKGYSRFYGYGCIDAEAIVRDLLR